jgi:hypothetical protein
VTAARRVLDGIGRRVQHDPRQKCDRRHHDVLEQRQQLAAATFTYDVVEQQRRQR